MSEMAIQSISSIVGDASPIATLIGGVWLFYWLVSSGRIIPKTTFDMIVTQYDKILESKDKTIAAQERQIKAQEDAVKTTKEALEALEEVSTNRKESKVDA